MAALINTIQINYYKQQYQRTQRTNQVRAYSEVRSVVSQPKCHLIQLFSWILDDGRAPATGIRRVNLEPADGNISPVSVRSALFKVAGYPGNFSCRGSARAALSNRNARARIGEPAVTPVPTPIGRSGVGQGRKTALPVWGVIVSPLWVHGGPTPRLCSPSKIPRSLRPTVL